MYHRSGPAWIGFEEAQRSIDALKEEVQIAERKLLSAKRSLKVKKPTKYEEIKLLPKPTGGSSYAKLKKQKLSSSFKKETLPKHLFQQNKNFEQDMQETIPKYVYVESSEENPKSVKVSLKKPEKLSRTLVASATQHVFEKISSSDNSFSSDFKHSSSERTSSLIADAYKHAEKELIDIIERNEDQEFKDTQEVSLPRQKDILDDRNKLIDKEVFPLEKSQQVKNKESFMEWKVVKGNRPFFQRRKPTSDNGLQKLKSIIEQQKQRFEAMNFALETVHAAEQNQPPVFSGDIQMRNSNASKFEELNGFHSNFDFNSEIKAPPSRKICRVLTVPQYKGFCVPGAALTTSMKGSYHNIKKPSVSKSTLVRNNSSSCKRKKTAVKDKKDLSSASWNDAENKNLSNAKNEPESEFPKKIASDVSSEEHSEESKSKEKRSGDMNSNSSQEVDEGNATDAEIKPSLTSENINLEASLAAELDNSNNMKLDYEDFKSDSSADSDEDKNSRKENIKPAKSFKSVKRKAKLPPEQKAPSPKIRHYDVQQVRDYMQKKKMERRKRHMEEHKKHMLETQKKKEGLQKLYEYQKQSIKSVTKVKPLSPLKLLQKKNVRGRKQRSINNGSSLSPVLNSELGNSFENAVLDDKIQVIQMEVGKSKTNSERSNPQTDEIPRQSKDSDFVTVDKLNLPNPQNSLPEIISNVSFKADEHILNDFISKSTFGDKKSLKDDQDIVISKKGTGKVSKGIQVLPISSEYGSSEIHSSYVSSQSTPSHLSQITDIDEGLLEALRNTKRPIHNIKSKPSEALKNLVKSIDEMTEPYEHFFRTKKWVDESPPPPSRSSHVNLETLVKEPHQTRMILPKKSLDFRTPLLQPQENNTKGSSFKEQITGIGDISQLYETILGRRLTQNTGEDSNDKKKAHFENSNVQNNVVNDDLVEGSLESDEDEDLTANEIKADLGKSFSASYDGENSHFVSEFNKLPVLKPDPFNFINTWNRKPLGIPILPSDAEISAENYSSDFADSSNKSMQFIDTFRKNVQNEFTVIDESQTASPLDVQKGNISNASNKDEKLEEIRFPEKISSSNVALTKQSMGKSDTLISGVLSSETSLDYVAEQGDKKGVETSPKYLSLSESSISEVISVVENSKNKKVEDDTNISYNGEENKPESSSVFPEMISENSFTSEFVNSAVKSSISENVSLNNSTGNSSILIPENVEIGNNDSLSNGIIEIVSKTLVDEIPENINEINDEISEEIKDISNGVLAETNGDDAVSDSVSDLSKVMSQKSGSNKESEVTESELSIQTSGSGVSSHTTSSSKKKSEKSSFYQKMPQIKMNTISCVSSQKNITIDFTQPVRVTFSNKMEAQNEKSLELQDKQYLDSHVVTRVASEAAAAAATSAVIAVLETQKTLLGKKHINVLDNLASSELKSKQHDSSTDVSSSPKSSENLESKPTDSEAFVQEEIRESSAAENDSVEEKVNSSGGSNTKHTIPASHISSKSLSTEIEDIHSLVSSRDLSNGTIKMIARNHKRKISGNLSSPSPASLSDNESISSGTIISSNSATTNFSQQNESVHSDDSFAQLTLDVVRRMTHEEELRARHQLSLLQFQEQTLVEKARAEMMWLELLKKKLREKGADRKVSAIKKRQKELILRLRQERAQLRCMQEAYRSICEQHRSLLEDKKKLLNEPSSLAYQILNKKETVSKYSEDKDFTQPKTLSSSTPTIASDIEIKVAADEEETAPEIPEVLKGFTSNSSQESVIETQASEHIKSSSSSLNKSHKSSPTVSMTILNPGQSNSNLSLHSNNSLESALQGLKKLEASKRHLTKREQRILQRRKHVESLLQWQMKLDSEEMAVRELEQKALQLVDSSKKRAKYYVSSPSVEQNGRPKAETTAASLTTSSDKSQENMNMSDNAAISTPTTGENGVTSESQNLSVPEENIQTTPSGSGIEEDLSGGKESNGPQLSSVTSPSSVLEELKNGGSETSVKTEASADGSHVTEVISDETSSNVGSTPLKEKSSSTDQYSESFESTTNKKTPTLLSNSSVKHSPPSKSIKKDAGFNIRLPLIPRNLRRHDSSGSDDSYTISQSETASDQSDIEVRIHALAEELRRRKAEAEKLKREQKKRYREKLKEKELSLQKQLEAYNQYIQQAKLELEHQLESAVSPPQSTDSSVVKPQIKWPRPDHVLESRRMRKQSVLASDAIGIEKKSLENSTSSPESVENAAASSQGKGTFIVKKLYADSKGRNEIDTQVDVSSEKGSDVDISRTAIESKHSSDEVSTEINESSEITEPSKATSDEVLSDRKEESEVNSSISNKISEIESVGTDIPNKSGSDAPISNSISEQDKSFCTDSQITSHSDTFVSDSSTSNKSETGSLKQEEDHASVHRKSSVDKEQNADNFSGEVREETETSDKSHSSNMTLQSENVHSSETESISEANSFVNSGSLDEAESGDTNENSKCNSSDGCPIPASSQNQNLSPTISNQNNVLSVELKAPDEPNKLEKFPQFSIENKTLEKPTKKAEKSETFVVNVVNFIYTSLFDDAMKVICSISKKINSNKSKILHSSEYEKSASFYESSNISTLKTKIDENADKISDVLFTEYVEDAINSILLIFESLKLKSQNCSENTTLNNKRLEFKKPEQNINELIVVSNESAKKYMNLFSTGNEYHNEIIDEELSTSSQNDFGTFSKQANWLEDAFVLPQSDAQIQQLEQQIMLQQYPYYYRKIPNKPPPPYTPPAGGIAGFQITERPVEKLDNVKPITENIIYVIDGIIEKILDDKEKGLSIYESANPEFTSVAEKLDLTMPNQVVFMDLIFDLSKEILLELYNESEPEPQPWLRPRKLTPKPLFPVDKKLLVSVLQKQIQRALKLSPSYSSIKSPKQTIWSAMKLGRKKRDFVDTILISELKEEEPDWVNYDQDELTVKFQIADSIFNVLIDDTVKVIHDIQSKMST